jgi:hypothetical protein
MTRTLASLAACTLLCACEPAAIALLGAGATSTLRYNLDGVAARTFTAPAAAVKSASLAALERMGIKLESESATESSALIYARAARRDIEIEVEPITERATRLRVTARDDASIFYDSATALEIVQQTAKSLASAAVANSSPAALRAATLVEN